MDAPFDTTEMEAEARARFSVEKLSFRLREGFPALARDFGTKWENCHHAISSSSTSSSVPLFDALVALGPKIIPFVVYKLALDSEDAAAVQLYNEIEKNTKFRVNPANAKSPGLQILAKNFQRNRLVRNAIADWAEHCERVAIYSTSDSYTECEEYDQLLELFGDVNTRRITGTMNFTPLILAGGKSTRMKSPKHLLEMPDGRPLYKHQIDLLAHSCSNSPVIYISLAQDSELDDYLISLPTINSNDNNPSRPSSPFRVAAQPNHNTSNNNPQIKILHDLHPNPHLSSSSGPAAGLLAAHRFQPTTTWLVLACDYPFVTPAAIQHLCREYQLPWKRVSGWGRAAL
ncbi:hypothetical protein VTI74DRAFT_4311 [Chaetomium olivicolor]